MNLLDTSTRKSLSKHVFATIFVWETLSSENVCFFFGQLGVPTHWHFPLGGKVNFQHHLLAGVQMFLQGASMQFGTRIKNPSRGSWTRVIIEQHQNANRPRHNFAKCPKNNYVSEPHATCEPHSLSDRSPERNFTTTCQIFVNHSSLDPLARWSAILIHAMECWQFPRSTFPTKRPHVSSRPTILHPVHQHN